MKSSTQLSLLSEFDNLGLRSAKRTITERSGVHAWHPYYAGYSERFVDSATDFLGLSHDSLVVDPWNGAGTTTFVSERKGLLALGFDINPVMSIFGTAKSGLALTLKEHVPQILLFLDQAARVALSNLEDDDALGEVFSPSLARVVRAFKFAIDAVQEEQFDADPCIVKVLASDSWLIKPWNAFLTACLFVTMRKLGKIERASNPTWFKATSRSSSVTYSRFREEYGLCLHGMINTAVSSGISATKVARSVCLVGDSRQLPLKDATIDVVVTSPPYLTRIDYAVSTTPELLVLGDAANVRAIRELSMGATVILKTQPEPDRRWGPTCLQILNAVRSHESKASETYYFKNMKQYFSDAHTSLQEIHRILKPGGKALIVVQSSYFKDVEIPLGDIYQEMGLSHGFAASRAYREIVKGHIAHVNTRSSKYIKNKIYFEDFVLLQKGD